MIVVKGQNLQKNLGNINAAVKVTVGLMVRNEEPYLADTIECLLKQTFKDFQVIIADNASEDNTKQIASSYAQRDKRIIYHRHDKNIGAVANYNWLIKNAHGDYFVLAGAHDYVSANYLECLADALDRDSAAVLAYTPTIWMDEDGHPMSDRKTGFIDTSSRSDIQRFNMVIWVDQHALYGMCRLDSLRKTRLQLNILGSGAVLLAELALLGTFIVAPEANWYRRINRAPETHDEAMVRYAQMLFVKQETEVLPHWRIPIAYFGAVVHSNLKIFKKFILFLCVFNVFIMFRTALSRDLADFYKKVKRKIFHR